MATLGDRAAELGFIKQMATLGDRAAELGFTSTDFFDISQGHPGVEMRGSFNPKANDWRSRYGTSGSMIEYNPRNWAGAHAPAGNVDAPIVYVKVLEALGMPVEPSANDLSDLDLVDGLTRFIMDKAGILRITADSVLGQPSGSSPGQPPSGGGDPCADVKAQLAQALADLKADSAKLGTIQAAANKARRVLPSGPGGGKYAVALRTLIGEIDAQVKG